MGVVCRGWWSRGVQGEQDMLLGAARGRSIDGLSS